MMKKGVHGPLGPSGNTPPPVLDYRPPPDTGLDILHQDEEIVVLSKPEGLLSVPGKPAEQSDSMETRVRKRFPGVLTVHRLDRATSGIVIMALTANAHLHLNLQFEKRTAEKSYKAIVSGRVDKDKGILKQPLRTDWYNRPKQMVDPCLGREAITRWTVVERHCDTTRVELKPVTGRTHQLRVHMQWLGHPILGDEFYSSTEGSDQQNRLMLHAESLCIQHPATGDAMYFSDPCPF